jgi:transcriptional regulator with XRE-family HTH domain
MTHPLKTYRDEEKLTQRGLGQLLGVSRTTVARWESGARKTGRDLLPKIAEKTGIAPRILRPDLAELLDEVAQ